MTNSFQILNQFVMLFRKNVIEKSLMNYSIAVITFYLLRPLKLTNHHQSQIQSVQLFITFAT
jgi:hypothetical protein